MTDRDPTPITYLWRGHEGYQCRLCAFNSLDKAVFEDHFAKVHPPLRIIEGGNAAAEEPATEQEPADKKPVPRNRKGDS